MKGQILACKMEKIFQDIAVCNDLELLVDHLPSSFVGSAGMGNSSSEFSFQYENSFETLCSFKLDHIDHMDKFSIDRTMANKIGYGYIKYSDSKALDDFITTVRTIVESNDTWGSPPGSGYRQLDSDEL